MNLFPRLPLVFGVPSPATPLERPQMMLSAAMRRGAAVARFARAAPLRSLTMRPAAATMAPRVGKALAFGGLASALAEVTRCDDDDDGGDGGPKTPAQLKHAAKIEHLTEQAKSVSITPGMAIFLVGGLAAPLGGFIAQGGGLATTFAGLVLSIPCLYSVVGFATQVSEKDGRQMMKDAEALKFPSLLAVSVAVGIVAPAAATILRSGHFTSTVVALAGSVVTTALIYKVSLYTPGQDI